MLEPLDFLVLAGLSLRAVETRGDAAIENLVDEGGFPRAGDTRHEGQRPEREFHVDVLEIVLCRAHNLERVSISLAPLGGHGNELPACEVLPRDGGGILHNLLRRPLGDHFAAMLARTGADVDDVVGGIHCVLVMLHNDQRIAKVAQMAQGREQTVVVALVQTNARLV